MIKNKNVVYSGKVGSNTKPRKHRMPSQTVLKSAMACRNGPMVGRVLYLATNYTLPFTYKGQTGRYVGGVWEKIQ